MSTVHFHLGHFKIYALGKKVTKGWDDEKIEEVVSSIIVCLVDGADRDSRPKILATQRGYEEFKDKWEFPGGKIEPGETPQEALVREIREELGAEIRVGEFLTTVEYTYPNFHLIMHCYLCSVVSGELVLNEHEAARWLGSDELYSVDWLPADVDVVKAVERYLAGSVKTKDSGFGQK